MLLRVLPDGDVHFPEAPGACVVVNPCLSGGALEIFLEPQVPPRCVRVFGATPIADSLVELCAAMGYDAVAGDAGDLGGATAVVIASLGGPEAETIRAALDAGVGYIGLVASRVRGASILARLELTDAERARVHTPVGLQIGAEDAAEIAVSIVAGGDRGRSGSDGHVEEPTTGERSSPMSTSVSPALRRAATTCSTSVPHRRSIWRSPSVVRCCSRASPASARPPPRRPLPPCRTRR